MLNGTLYDGWEPLVRTLILTVLAYPLLLLTVRLSGHRTLAKLNAFDLVVTVALGSTLATLITSSNVSLAQGVLAFVLLALSQYIVAKLTVKSRKAEDLINGDAKLLFHKGAYLKQIMREERITEQEIQSAARSQGHASLESVQSVVLETNGTMSVTEKKSDS